MNLLEIYVDFSTSLWMSVGISQAICLLNVLAGLSIARKTFHKRFEQFIGIVIGSMVVRIVISAILVWLCISVLHVHILSFAISFCIGTFVYLFVEIFYFHKLADSPAVVPEKNDGIDNGQSSGNEQSSDNGQSSDN